MAEEHQQSRPAQPQGQQPSGKMTQESQRRGNGQQTGMVRRSGGLSSIFRMDPFDMLRMSPFAMMRRFMEEMDQYMARGWQGRGGEGRAAAGSEFFSPAMEVFEREGHLVVRADLPGMTKDDVHVEVTDDALTIAGERRSEHEEKQGGLFRSERSYGTFHRQFPLPEGVNADQITANFKDGVLEISMPAPQRQARGRRIDIQSGTSSQGGAPQEAGHEASVGSNQEGSHRTAGRS
jgi:HSP20 family protein